MPESNEIIKIALLGTSNFNEISDDLLTDFEQKGFKIDKNLNAERQVLQLLSAFSLLKKTALALPIAEKNKIIPPETDDSEKCSDSAAELLALLISQNQPELVSEWITLHLIRKIQVSDSQLVNLLNFGLIHPELQNDITRVSGKKAVWLASYNSEWSYCKEPREEDFFFGNKKQRQHYIKKIRNENPTEAIQLLEKTWKEESYQNKLEFLKLLSVNLSEADIPFLEMALKDNKPEIKKEALNLLSSLPDSEIIKKLNAVLFEFVKIKSTDKINFELNLPDQISDELKSYGIVDKNMPLNADMKPNFLAQLLALLPISYWESYEMKIANFLESFSSSSYSQAWYWGLTTSAIRSKNDSWLEKIHIFLNENHSTPKYGINFSIDFFSENLSNEVFNKLCLFYLNSNPNALYHDGQFAVMKMLLEPNRKWTDALAMKVMDKIRLLIMQRKSVYSSNKMSLLKNASFSMNPKLLHYYEKWPEEISITWQIEINNFKSVMESRKRMIELFD